MNILEDNGCGPLQLTWQFTEEEGEMLQIYQEPPEPNFGARAQSIWLTYSQLKQLYQQLTECKEDWE